MLRAEGRRVAAPTVPCDQRVEVRDEVVGEESGVVAGAVDVGRGAGAKHREPEGVEPGGIGDDAAVVAEAARAVEDREVEPRVVGPEAGGPDDGADRRCRRGRGRDTGGPGPASARAGSAAAGRRRAPASRRPGVGAARKRAILRSASVHTLRSEPEKRATPSSTAASRPTRRTPSATSDARSTGTARADELRRRQPAGAGRGRRPRRGVPRARRWRAATRRCRARGSVRGRRTCSPTARVTGRPARRSSAASCTPVADAPTTSTPPSGSESGPR